MCSQQGILEQLQEKHPAGLRAVQVTEATGGSAGRDRQAAVGHRVSVLQEAGASSGRAVIRECGRWRHTDRTQDPRNQQAWF